MIIVAEICIIINDISRLGHQIMQQEILAKMLLHQVCTSQSGNERGILRFFYVEKFISGKSTHFSLG